MPHQSSVPDAERREYIDVIVCFADWTVANAIILEALFYAASY